MFNIYMHNIRSLKNKFEEIEAIPNIYKQTDILALTETWLRPAEEQLYQIENYNSVYNSRNSKGGGIAFYIKENIKYKILMNKTIEKIEIITILIENANLSVTLIYKPPQITLNILKTVLKHNVINRKSDHILMGDFNINILANNTTTKDYYNLFEERNYKIVNMRTKKYYTRKHPLGNNSILDHVITNVKEKLEKLKIIPTEISDHNAILTKVKIKQERTRSKYETIETTKTDYPKISAEINEMENNVTSFENLTTAMQKIIEGNQKTTTLRRRQECPWINEEIIRQIKNRNKLCKKHKRHLKNNTYKMEYENQKEYTKDLIKNTKKLYYQNLIKKHSKNTSKIWNIINNQIKKTQKNKNTIEEIIKEDGSVTQNAKEIANELNKSFATTGKKLAEKQINEYKKQPQTTKTRFSTTGGTFEKTSEEEIEQIIKELKKNTAPGHDKITTNIVQQNKRKLIPILSRLINKSLEEGIYPQCLKTTIIVPIYKKGNKNDPQNYRPISLLSTLNKILEKVLHNRITKHIQRKNIINSKQYAFQKQSGTVSAAYDLTNNIKKELDQNKTVVAIFIDMKKAFDTVCKEKLIEKMKHYGYTQKHLNLIETYLKNRKQATKVNNVQSDWLEAEYGLPQGGNLPPTLYILYTNDLHEQPLTGQIYAYADDTCLLYSSKNAKEIEQNIEKDMQQLENWCFDNLLTINETKTEYMVFSNKKTTQDIPITLKKQRLKETKETTYLGLKVQNSMKWEAHIQKVIEQNAKTIAALNKIKFIIPAAYRKSIYHALFTAPNNYLITIWGNTTNKHLQKLQRQQNKILKIIYKLDYHTATNEVYKTTQELNIRQIITLNNLLLLHKIRHNKIKIGIKLNTNEQVHGYKTRRISHIRTERFMRKKYTQTLTTQIINTYNVIPKQIKDD